MHLTVPVTWLPPTAKVMTEPALAAISRNATAAAVREAAVMAIKDMHEAA